MLCAAHWATKSRNICTLSQVHQAHASLNKTHHALMNAPKCMYTYKTLKQTSGFALSTPMLALTAGEYAIEHCTQ